jgi:glyoxylase I family protein
VSHPLEALELQLLQTAVRNQAARVDELLADDFVEFGASGRVWTKAAIIAALQDEPPTERRMSEFQAHPLAAGVVLVTYRVEREGTSTLRSSVWVREGDRWRMRFHQGTAMASSGTP